jgi:Xaa-Pro aminopeptidase
MDKISLIRDLMGQYGITGYIVPSTDQWQNEYASVPRLEFISGFSGSNGVLIITRENLLLYTDSRYTAQAKIELSKDYTILDIYKKDNCKAMKLCKGSVIGYDPMIVTGGELKYYEKLGNDYKFKLLPLEINLVDILTNDTGVDIVEISSEDGSRLCSKIINALPQYFAIPQANESYIDSVRTKENFAAKIDSKYCGMISIDCNYSGNANIYWLGIYPDAQGMKLGTYLINHVSNLIGKRGIKTLTVETVSPSVGDENYLKTYNFYQKLGFTELFSLKPANYQCKMSYMVKAIDCKNIYRVENTSQVMILPETITGESSESKINRLVKFLPKGCNYLLLTDPASICWLLNIRGHDIEYNTLLLSYALVSRNEVILFANIDVEIPNVTTYDLSSFKQFLLDNKDKTFALDINKSSVWFSQNLKNIVDIPDPVIKMKAIKNPIEISGIKMAHIYDGIALCKFWFWLYMGLKSGEQVTEISATDKLHQFRKMNESFLYESFATISAYGSNGAIVHYKPKENNCKKIPSNSCDYIYLLDSGGQYMSAGTTDVTRVFDIGKIFGVNKYEHKMAYTTVLKGHIKLANTTFPLGTTGSQLDSLARYDLWQSGLDYGHGTGHCVGHFLSVHEGPCGISGRNNCQLEENMVLSIEPGYYKEGSFGIRIENLYLVKKSSKFQNFLEFELLTMVPIETSLIDFTLLTEDEIDWLRTHNDKVVETLKSYMSSEETDFIVSNSKVKNSK